MIPITMTAIYNECLRTGCFPDYWKVAKLLPIVKSGRENSSDTSKYRPISLLNTEGKVLGKLLRKRIMHHLFKTEYMNVHQYGFTPENSTVDAAMEVKQYIEPHLERGGVVILVSLDVYGAFDWAWWPAILQGLREAKCPRNIYYLAQDYLKERKAIITINSFNMGKNMTRGCSQGSFCGPSFWNIQYDSVLNLQYVHHTSAVTFADDLILMIRADSIREAENIANVEMDKIATWAENSKTIFNEEKSTVMLMTRRKREEQK
jgi:hypothetical protein